MISSESLVNLHKNFSVAGAGANAARTLSHVAVRGRSDFMGTRVHACEVRWNYNKNESKIFIHFIKLKYLFIKGAAAILKSKTFRVYLLLENEIKMGLYLFQKTR